MVSRVWSVRVSQETFEELERRCIGVSRSKFVESLLGIDTLILSSGVYTRKECIQVKSNAKMSEELNIL